MKASVLGLGVLALSVFVGGTAVASEQICTAQRAAAADLVEARDNATSVDEVIAEVRAAASTDASAEVLSESVHVLYNDPSMDAAAAAELIYDRCIGALGN
ncbi:hypothetical protein CAI21_20900 [Alkalilimnicola ehrlichii]|uniref:Uncharacterized protein n=1 Tax=Alkalilimnicola ehrlichii TaxID=351052 RepID=A0A3E0WNM1_9GAMM|nr:hypothetical protein [Alkalilimnicola ehrlichii]RFA24672.1 hypothetical protein CAI21_20900 [Alkalilimnicola ehrlichii]RFA33751.1 hypothetical protein CAL65_16520 [Alkalilimnicola ehrlichii]